MNKKPTQARITNPRGIAPAGEFAPPSDAPARPTATPPATAAGRGSNATVPVLPRLPRAPRKSKTGRPCECGCAVMTRGGRFYPGHDSKLYAWARRVERGIIKIGEVPEVHREAVRKHLKVAKKGE